MSLEILGHRVLVKPKQIEEKTAGGIIIPDQTRDKEQAGIDEGEVIAIGPTAFKDLGGFDWVKVGDWVVWPRYAGKPYEDEGILYHAINDEDILMRKVK